jgi:di/tricarboxylate transporter
MVMGPGGYTTKTFVKFGIPVTIVALAVGILVGWTLLK